MFTQSGSALLPSSGPQRAAAVETLKIDLGCSLNNPVKMFHENPQFNSWLLRFVHLQHDENIKFSAGLSYNH